MLQSNVEDEKLMARSEMDGLIETHKDEVTRLVAGRGGTVRWNPHIRPGSLVYDRFIKAGSGLPAPLQPATTKLAFHGTPAGNIESIFQNGMDPMRRRSGDCDWYGAHIDEGNVQNKGGNKRLVFALLVGLGGGSGFSGHPVITGTKSEHALPLGVISLAA